MLQALLAAEQAADRARYAQAEYEHHLEAKREANRMADKRREEAERLAAEAAEEEERRRQAEEQRKAALRKPNVDEIRRATMKDWPVLS